jgi:hypothetical protein
MSTIVTRAGKGSPLTNNEVDANFTNLNTDKVQVTGTPTTGQAITWTGTVWAPSTITAGVSSVASADGSVVVTTVSGAVDLSVGIAGSTGTLIAQVRNQTGSTLTKGTLVYITGGSGNKAVVSKSQANAESTSAGTFGMIQADIATNNNGYVVIVGPVSGLNTIAYTEGTVLYLDPSTAGGYTSTKPSAPNHMVYIGTVIYSHATQGTIEVRIQNGYELEELHNVAITTATQGDVLIRNGTTNVWENKAQSNLIAGNVSGTVAVANGGTGATTANAAFNALAPSQSTNSGKYLTTDGTNTSWASVTAGVSQIIAGTNVTISPSGGTGAVTINATGTTASYVRTAFTATAGQTSFSVTYTVGYVEIFLNGVLLNSADYTASSGTAIVLASGALVGDIVEVIAYNSVAIGTLASTGVLGGISGQVLTSNGTNSYWAAAPVSLPSQTGNANKYLKTDGTNASWNSLPTNFPIYLNSGSTTNIPVATGTFAITTNSGSTINITVT